MTPWENAEWWHFILLASGFIAVVNLLPKMVLWWLVNVEKVDFMKPDKCCNEAPTVLEECIEICNNECLFACTGRIECQVCGRIVYGSNEEVERWNNGEDDE